MANQLNGKNFSLFGLFFQKESTDAFLLPPERKESTSHDFLIENGTDIDLDEPRFAAREFTVHCAIIARGATIDQCFTNFWLQYNGFFTELQKPGLQSLYIDDHKKVYELYYRKAENVKKLTQISNQLKVGMTFDLVFAETDPFQNFSKVYLVDQAGRYLIC